MNKSNNNIKLGLFVLLIFAIFTFVVYKVSGGGGLINNNIKVHVEFENAKGLLIGNVVRYSGVKIGTISKMEIISDKLVTVSMSLDKDAETYMKANAQAEIGTNGLVGNMIINIIPGVGESPFIKNGDKIIAKNNIELAEMLTTLSTTNERIDQITESLLEITKKINSGSGSISLLINDQSIAQNLVNTSRNLSEITSSINTSTQSLNDLMVRTEEGKGNLGYLFKDNSLKTKVDDISSNLDSLLNDRLEPILRNVESSSKTIANTTIELEKIVKDLDNEKGILGMVNDTLMVQELKSTINNLNKGTEKFDENMEALQHNWLLRKYFKKKAKKN